MTIDLTSLQSLETDELHVRHPVTGDPTGWVITFAGPGHPKTIALEDDVLRRRLKANKVGDGADTVDMIKSAAVAAVAGRILSWAPDVEINGQTLSCGSDAVRKLLAEPSMRWLFIQCSEFLSAAESFFSRPRNGS